MVTAEFTQYLLPDGRQKQATFEIADDLQSHLTTIEAVGARLECEVLTTGAVSLTVTSEDGNDFDIELVPNGPEVPAAVDRLVRRFNEDAYLKYVEHCEQCEEEAL